MRGLVVIPALDEAARIGPLLDRVASTTTTAEVVVIDDGSKDDTAAIARNHGATVLRHPFNLGYGAALQTGYKYAVTRRVDWLVQLDADGQHHPELIPVLLRAIEEDELDLVVGSRFLAAEHYEMGRLQDLGRRIFSAIARLAGLRVSDPTSGFQAMNRTVIELFTDDFFPSDYPDVDVLVAAYRCGLRIGEEPVEMDQGTRPSNLHGGLTRSLYYAYKMMLSLWTTPARLSQLRRDVRGMEDRRT